MAASLVTTHAVTHDGTTLAAAPATTHAANLAAIPAANLTAAHAALKNEMLAGDVEEFLGAERFRQFSTNLTRWLYGSFMNSEPGYSILSSEDQTFKH